MNDLKIRNFIPGLELKDTVDDFSANVMLVPTGSFWGKDVFSLYPDLQVVASNTTGDGHIDTEWCKEREISVITLKNNPILYDITAVSELTIGLMVMLTRNVFVAYQSVLLNDWDRYRFGGKKMLSEMTLGIIGRGRIGIHVEERAKPLFRHILTYDRYSNPVFDLLELLEYSDIVTLHIPVNGNLDFFGFDEFNQMKQGAYFINTSRGEVVDDAALLWALENKLGGAAVDVLSGEFDEDFEPQQSELVQYAKENSNLIITPHIGGSTETAWYSTQRAIIEKIFQNFGVDTGES